MIIIKSITYLDSLGKRVDTGEHLEKRLANEMKDIIKKKYYKTQTKISMKVI